MSGMVQEFGQPAVKTGIHHFIAALEGNPALAAIQGLARQPGFNVLQGHLRGYRTFVRIYIYYAARLPAASIWVQGYFRRPFLVKAHLYTEEMTDDLLRSIYDSF